MKFFQTCNNSSNECNKSKKSFDEEKKKIQPHSRYVSFKRETLPSSVQVGQAKPNGHELIMGCAICEFGGVFTHKFMREDNIMILGCRHFEWRIKAIVQTTMTDSNRSSHSATLLHFISFCVVHRENCLVLLCCSSRKKSHRILLKQMVQNHRLLVKWKPIITLMNVHSFNFDNNSNNELPWDNRVTYIAYPSIHAFADMKFANGRSRRRKRRKTNRAISTNQIIFHSTFHISSAMTPREQKLRIGNFTGYPALF